MKKTKLDIIVQLPGLIIYHQKISSYEVGRHQHQEHEIFFPLQGEITVNYNDKKVKAGPGRMLYVPPGIDHSFSSSAVGSGERVIVLIDDNRWAKQLNEKFEPSSLPVSILSKEIIFYLLVHQKAKGMSYFVSALIEALGEALSGAKINGKNIYSEHISARNIDSRVQKSIEIIEEQLSEITMQKLAEESGLSLRNLNRLFLKECGLSPKDFLILRRVERAKRLLLNPKATVTDTALEVGYNSLSKFIALSNIFPNELLKLT